MIVYVFLGSPPCKIRDGSSTTGGAAMLQATSRPYMKERVRFHCGASVIDTMTSHCLQLTWAGMSHGKTRASMRGKNQLRIHSEVTSNALHCKALMDWAHGIMCYYFTSDLIELL